MELDIKQTIVDEKLLSNDSNIIDIKYSLVGKVIERQNIIHL
jgi:hypothetical protein